MSLEFFSQVIIIPLTLIAGFLVFKKYMDRGGIYLYIFTICFAIWCFLYSLIFSTSLSLQVILLMTKIMYATSMIGVYSFLIFYFYFIDIEVIKKLRGNLLANFIYLVLGVIIFTLVVKTSYIIQGMEFSQAQAQYRETYGIYYGIFHYFYIASCILLLILLFLTSKYCKNPINRIRALVIGIGFFFSFGSGILILVVLPLYGVIIFEKQAIFVMIPFIVSVFYSLNNYIFFSFQKKLIEILVFIFSFFISYTVYFFFKEVYIYSFFGSHGANFWGLSSSLGFFDILSEVLLFLLVRRYLSKQARLFIQDFGNLIESIKNKVLYTTSFEELNYTVEKYFKEGIGIKNTTLQISNNIGELEKYFSEKREHNLIINDKIFIGEDPTGCNKEKLLKEVSKLGYIIFPLYKESIFVGVISFGKRLLGNYYSKEEVIVLENFSKFIQGHLKYLDIYSEIHDLNLNLEKRVDEKTIELNATISRQKEFIEVVSHEIRTPLATALFQIEGLEGDILDIKMEKKKIIVDQVKSLYGKVTDTVNLVNRLFTIERFEANKIQLYKTKVNLASLIRQQVEGFEKAYKKVEFTYDQIQDVGTIDLDIIQFNQVVDNIISNAIKFTSQVQNPKISIALVKQKNEIVFTIEDSGLGFGGVDISKLFDKYSTGKSSSIGLGMGLYLCKKIVELHGGKISASKSKELGGATFKIVLPK